MVKQLTQAINENEWFAVVDTEKNSIIHIDGDPDQAREFINDVILRDEEDEWLKMHPECKDAFAPDEVLDSLARRFVIVNCSVNVTANAKVWTEDEPPVE